MELTQEQKEALKRALMHLIGNSINTNLVYISPAQQLRIEAERIEQKERDYPILMEILEMLKD